MDEDLLKIFEQETLLLCELAASGREVLRRIEEDSARGEEGGAGNRTYLALLGIVGTAANVAKMLWGSRGPEVEAEREPLRQAAGVTDESPLKRRGIRNGFEHLDERLMDWHRRHPDQKNYAMRTFHGKDGQPKAPVDAFGSYDRETGELVFWGESISIPALIAEMARIGHNIAGD
jgi:hypothetical protein